MKAGKGSLRKGRDPNCHGFLKQTRHRTSASLASLSIESFQCWPSETAFNAHFRGLELGTLDHLSHTYIDKDRTATSGLQRFSPMPKSQPKAEAPSNSRVGRSSNTCPTGPDQDGSCSHETSADDFLLLIRDRNTDTRQEAG